MNKKIISSFVTLAFVFNVSVCFSAEKKDVTDPVLREMINSLSSKMPKFINQYGASVFVADEKVTRGALIKALYEYDKKTSGGSGISATAGSEDVGLTKKQYTALSNRIAALERNSASTTGGKTKAAYSGSVDIVAVMNDLEPNMPMLLDNTLTQSKVFKDLQRKVALASSGTKNKDSGTFASDDSVLSKSDSRSMLALRKEIAALNKKIDSFELELASSGVSNSNSKNSKNKNSNAKNSNDSNELEEMKAKLIQIQRGYVAMSKRVNELENNQTALADNSSSGKNSSLSNAQVKNINLQIASIKKTVANIPTNDYVDAEIQKANIQTAKDIKRIEYRLNNLKRSGKFVEKEPKESSSEGSSTTGTIAKISLGLTMIAALFIAR